MAIGLVVLSALLGAADQFMGSWSAHPWAIDASLLAAPWLVFPFIVGATQTHLRRAVALAAICTSAALVGYIAMTLSPVEGAKFSLSGVLELVRWQIRWFVLGALTSPFFGWLGHRWRTTGVAWPVVVAAATLCCEPVGRTVIGQSIRSSEVRVGEVLAGATLALGAVALQLARRPVRSERPQSC